MEPAASHLSSSGGRVLSAYGGPEDRDAYGDYDVGKISSSPERQTPFSFQERDLFAHYKHFESLKLKAFENSPDGFREFEAAVEPLLTEQNLDWLLAFRILDFALTQFRENQVRVEWQQFVKNKVGALSTHLDPASQTLLREALAAIHRKKILDPHKTLSAS